MNLHLAYIDDIAKTVDNLVPERDGIISMVRGGGGFVRVMLVNPKERDRTQQEIADELAVALRKKTKARSMVMQQSTFGGRRAGMPIQYVLQATSIDKLREVLPAFMAKVKENPMFQMADVNLKFTKPELRIHIDREKASTLGSINTEYRSDIAACSQRTAIRIFLYEWKTIPDLG